MNIRFQILTLLIVTSVTCLAESGIQQARQKCVALKGMFVAQNDKVACFDPANGVVNDEFSPAQGHPKPEKQDFDLLTGQPIYFYRMFAELARLEVCNYTSGIIYIQFSHSMDALLAGPKSPPELVKNMETSPGVCRADNSHMFAIFPDLKTAQMAVGLCATPSGRPYYDRERYEEDQQKSLQDESVVR